MRKIQDKKTIVVSLILILVFFTIFFFTKNINQRATSAQSIENNQVQKAYLEIDNQKYETQIYDGESVYEMMNELKKQGKISFTDTNYIGMGKLIDNINGIKGANEKYWIYYVNGVEAKVGVSYYQLKNGDIVSWKYTNEKNN